MNKSIVQSTTTRAVAAGTAAGTGTVLAAVAWLRSIGALPWGEDQDEIAAVFIATLVVPVLSRWIKWALGRFGALPLGLIFALAALLVSGGCVTAQTPDGGSETRADIAATIDIMEAALRVLEDGYDAYLDRLDRADAAERDRLEREVQEREDRIATIRDALTVLREAQAGPDR